MTIEQLKEQKAALKEHWQAKAHLWNSIITSKWFFHDEGDTAMVEKMEVKAEKVWAEYEALLAQWDAVELQLIELERAALNVTVSDVQPESSESVTCGVECVYCDRSYIDCNCDYCGLEGHKWSLVYRVNDTYFRCCEVCGIEQKTGQIIRNHGASWMEEAVEEALMEDANGR